MIMSLETVHTAALPSHKVAKTARPSRAGTWLWLVAGAVMFAGLLFGYDQGVIGGALRGITHSFNTTTLVSEIITSWVTLGSLFGALGAGALADTWGRRTAILAGAGVFLVGVAVEAFAPGSWILVTGRVILGVGVGITSVAAPLYASEVAPTHRRGQL